MAKLPPVQRRPGMLSPRLFGPILAGADPRDRLRVCFGVAVALVVVGLQGAIVHGTGVSSAWIVAPMGASAVLIFAVPTSPMAQPWATIGGNGLSALTGLVTGALLGHGAFAGGVGVAAAIGVMSVTRSLHPPGGASALTAAIGGPAIGWAFPLAPVAMNAVVLVAAGWIFHRLVGHAYPHTAMAPTAATPPYVARGEDVDAVLAELGETFDVSPEDLGEIVRRVEAQVVARMAQATVRASGAHSTGSEA